MIDWDIESKAENQCPQGDGYNGVRRAIAQALAQLIAQYYCAGN